MTQHEGQWVLNCQHQIYCCYSQWLHSSPVVQDLCLSLWQSNISPWEFQKNFQNSGIYSHTVVLLRPVVVSWDGFLINGSGTSIAVGFHKLPGSKKKKTKNQLDCSPSLLIFLLNWRRSLPPPAHPPRSPVLWIWPYWTGHGGSQSSSDTQTHRTCRMPILALGCIIGKKWKFKGLDFKKKQNFEKKNKNKAINFQILSNIWWTYIQFIFPQPQVTYFK